MTHSYAIAMSSATVSELAIGALVRLVEQNRLAEAEKQARALIESHPRAGILWKILSVALVRQNKDALPALQRTAELMPLDAEAHGNLGAALHDQGQWKVALDSLRRGLEINPRNADAWADAAHCLRALGFPREAVPLYQRSLGMEPRNVEALNNLGNTLLELGQLDGALGCYQAALQIGPDDAHIYSNLGNALRQFGRFAEAAAAYQQALARNPHDVELLNTAGNVLRDLGRRREAAALFQSAIDADPLHAVSHCNLGTTLFEMRRVDAAATSLTRAIELQPENAAAHLGLGLTLRQLRRPDEAEASCRRAIAIEPDSPEALSFLGELQADRGHFADAESLFRRAIGLRPDFAFAYASIATHRKMSDADADWLMGAEAALDKHPPLAQEIGLRYALGKYFDDVQRYPEAFGHFREANELTKRYGMRYDAAKLSKRIDRLLERFGAGSVQAGSDGNDSDLPILILGMPRSGTSLTEQILASHPQVFGAGEVVFWHAAFDRLQAALDANEDPKQLLPAMAGSYITQLKDLSNGARHVVDKLPANFLYAGFIHAALPQARIIHMQRHPIDTCLSIYFQNFFNIGPYANDLHHLAHYYGEYQRIMDHWRRTLPPSRLLEIPYEGLINEQEAWTRRLLEFVGLPWDPRCLDFHQTERVVITASKWQVRQKMSRTSAGRWRNYESFIGPLLPLSQT